MSGVQSKINVYLIVDKVQNSYENTLKFDLIDNVVYVNFALYSRCVNLCTIIFWLILDCELLTSLFKPLKRPSQKKRQKQYGKNIFVSLGHLKLENSDTVFIKTLHTTISRIRIA